MRPPLKAVLFDLDGTLFDSIDLLLACMRHAFEGFDGPHPTTEDWVAGIGTPLMKQLAAYARTDTELLRRLTAPFRRTALFSASGNTPAGLPPLTALERDYAQLKSEIAKASDANAATRGNSLFAALLWSQATSVALLTLLSATLFALAWFLRDRMVDPLENLRRKIGRAHV